MLACEKYVFGLEAIEKFIGIKIPVESYDESMLGDDKSAGMKIHTERYGRRDYRDDDRRGHGRVRSLPRRPPRSEEPRRFSEEPRKHIEKIAAKPAGGFPEKAKQKQQESGRKDIRPNPIKKGTGHKMGPEERIAFYREKYGENFQPGEGARRHHGRNRRTAEVKPHPPAEQPWAAGASGTAGPAEKPTLIKKILGFFTRKKP
jgi:ATP-dependent RNA helicase RhlB